MKTTFFSQPALLSVIALAALIALTSCDKRIRKNGSGVVTSQTRQVSSFASMDADGSYELYVHQDETPHVVVTTDDNIQSEVQTFVQDGKLFIEMSDDYYNYHYTRMEVHVYGELQSQLDLHGSINAHVEDTIFSPSFSMFQHGSGTSLVRYSGPSVHLEVDGSANMECIGIATNAQLKINGSGKMDALDLLSVDMNAQIHGSGDIYVNCTSQLNASIDGSGKIRYIGNPSVTSSIVGSGSISPY